MAESRDQPPRPGGPTPEGGIPRPREAQQLARILEVVPGGIVQVGPRGDILRANTQAQRFLGLSWDELTQRYVADFEGQTYLEDGRPCPVDAYPVSTCLATGEEQPPMTIGVRQPDGEIRWAIFTALPFPAPNEAGLGAVVTFVDITDRRRAETQLAQAERLASVGTLAAGMAHEINNPLAYLILNLEGVLRQGRRLEEQLGSGAEAVDGVQRLLTHARDASEGAERVRRIVKDLMTFSRVTDEEEAPVDVNAAIEVAIEMAHHEIKYRAKLVRDLSPLDPVLGNDGRLSQVFLNLLLNAARAIEEGHPEDHEIRVASRMRGDELEVEVSDTGEGVDPAHLDRLFEPFFTTRAGRGAGLGLSICRNVVRAHGGRIDVESAPGEGSRFVVTLPRAPAPPRPEPSAPPPPPEPGEHRPRLLLVDDEPMVLRILGQLLSRRFDVVTADGLERAIETLEQGPPPDVVLCDMMMLDGTGVDVHAWTVEHRPELADRMVFMTGGTFTPKAREFLSEVAAHHLTKPFSLAELDEVVSKLLE